MRNRDETERTEDPCTRGHHAPVVLTKIGKKKIIITYLLAGSENAHPEPLLGRSREGGEQPPVKGAGITAGPAIPIHRRSIAGHCGPSALWLGEDQLWGGWQGPCNISQRRHLGNHRDFFNHILRVNRKLLTTLVQPKAVLGVREMGSNPCW